MVTIKDIAQLLEISPSTVARALADHPHTSEATKARVRSTAQKLGYIAHAGARSMRSQASRLVGLLIPDVQNDFYATVAKGLAEACNEAGFQLVLAITEDDPATELRHIRELSGARAAGVVIVPTEGPHRESVSLLRRQPVVQLIRRNAALKCDWMGIDDEGAIYQATRHLTELGHRRLGYVGGQTALNTGAARLAGFHRGLAESSIDPSAASTATGPPRASFARQAFVRMVESRAITGVVCGGARLTDGVLEGIAETGLGVPADISVVGFGDSPWFKLWSPGLTTLDLPVRDIALASGALLLRRIRERAKADRDTVESPCNAVHASFLVPRNSTAPR